MIVIFTKPLTKVVTAGLMDIYQRILGLKFTKIEGGEVTYDLITKNSTNLKFRCGTKMLSSGEWMMPPQGTPLATSTWISTLGT